MTIRQVLRAGEPLVRQKAREVERSEVDDQSIQSLIDDMFETMRNENGVGLAAPQVQSSVQVLVYEVEANERYPQIDESIAPKALINPEITERSGEMSVDWEGCLSLPDLRGKVHRHDWIKITALDRNGDDITFKAQGFEARVIQHEIDHLQGTLFIGRMRDMDSLSFSREYRRYQAET